MCYLFSVGSKVHCPGAYKCAWSKTCIPQDQVCDGHKQCIHGDDERLCNFLCPQSCTCNGYLVNCTNSSIEMSHIDAIPDNTRQLDLGSNRGLSSVLSEPNLRLTFLIRLHLSHCEIRTILPHSFWKLKQLRYLDISYNLIKTLYDNVFNDLSYLTILNLKGNFFLSTIEPGAFTGLAHIRHLDFADANIQHISANTFNGLVLEYIDLSNNSIVDMSDYAFNGLSVTQINFERNNILTFHKDIFTGIASVEKLITPAYKFCCIMPNYLKEDDCFPVKDEFSSCEDLMRMSVLQTMLWLIGVSALFGNACSIVYRLMYDRERLKLGYGVFVTNLAVADFFMGVYLVIIAIADAVFRKQ